MLTSRQRAGGGRSHVCSSWGLVRTIALTVISRDRAGGKIMLPGSEGKVAFDCRKLLAHIHKEVAL